MSEEVKQEGEFKMKTPTKPKNLGKKNEVTKIEIPKEGIESQGEVTPEVTKVEIKNEDAVQTQETNDSDAIVEESKDSGDSKEVVEEIRTTDEGVESPLTVVEDAQEEKQQEVVQEQQVAEQKQLPENIDKLVTFMEETGGTVEDYVRLNADYTNVDNTSLIREYYKQTKPHLDSEDVSLLLEDFDFDEDIDEPKEIRKKKIAFKEEAAKAKDFLEGLKSKYYDEIKLRPGVTQEQQKALDFFNRHNEEQQVITSNRNSFIDRTKNLFNDNFKGFDFKVGETKFRYGVKNPKNVAESQSNIDNFVKTFLNDKGEIGDMQGYHKALFAARNADTIAQHFYEQGKADAVKDVMAKSKNISTEPRQTAAGEVFVNGIKVKAMSGVDSSKLKIKKVTIKN
mgnify:FL=1|tara:strand:- start:1003 stop:2190 length:1188 start_codon:yes stop_codon:yes gene_type:complete